MPVTLQGPGATAFTGTEDKQYWIRKMLIRATPKLFYNQFAAKDYIPKNSGMNVEWRRESVIPASTTALVEGSFPAETVPTIVIVTASPPNPPPDFRDPFAEYFAKTFTSGRDGEPNSLRILLETAAEKGIPVACIWLTHTDAPVPNAPELQGPFQRFHHMQQEIQGTYRKYPYLLNFDSSASDADGVKQALLRTVQLLAARVSAGFSVVQ